MTFQGIPRLSQLLDKPDGCPNCEGKLYYCFGKDKGAQRFKFKECGRIFTDYNVIWQEGSYGNTKILRNNRL